MTIIVIDVETTGLDPGAGHTVVEIAAVALRQSSGEKNWELGSQPFTTLVAPGRCIPAEAAAVHHLREEDVRAAPHLPNAIDTMLRFHDIHPSYSDPPDLAIFAAHNAAFDRQFLDPILAHQLSYAPRWLCTYRLASHLYPAAPGHSNQVLRYHLNLDAEVRNNLPAGAIHQPHRALYDAITTAVILQHMLATHSLADLLVLQDQPILQHNIRFGKYRGRPWSSIPRDYLAYVARQRGPGGFDADVLHTANHYLSGGA